MKQLSQIQSAHTDQSSISSEQDSSRCRPQHNDLPFNKLCEDSIEALLVHKTDGKPLFANQLFASLLGYDSPQEILIQDSVDCMLDFRGDSRYRVHQDRLIGGSNHINETELAVLRKDGVEIKINVVSQLINWEEEPAIQTVVIGFNNKDLDKLAFSDAEEKLRGIATASQNAVILIDSEGNVTFWNDGAEGMFGYPRNQAIGAELAGLIIPEHLRDKHRTGMKSLSQTGSSKIGKAGVVKVQALRRSGEIFPVELSISPIRIKGGWGSVGIVTDLSHREQIEQRLKRDIKYQKAISNILKVSLEAIGLRQKLSKILDLVLSVPGLNIQSKGAVFLKTDASTLEVWAHRNLREIEPEKCSHLSLGYCFCSQALKSEKTDCIDETKYLHETHNLPNNPQSYYCLPIISGANQPLGILTAYVDKGHKKGLEAASFLKMIAATLAGVIDHHRMEQRFRSLSQAVEQSPASVVITDPKGNIKYVNSKFVEITGYTVEEVLGKNPRILKSGKTKPEDYEAMWKTISAGGEWRCEFQNLKKNGDLFIESANISPIKGKDGSITHYVAVKEDITERKIMQTQLAHSQKMESIGQLAAGIAHEINTPTQYVGDNLRFLNDAFADIRSLLDTHDSLLASLAVRNTPYQEQLETLYKLKEELDIEYLKEEIPLSICQALDGVTQVGRIVGAMKQFAHPGSVDKIPADLNAAIESTAIVARNEWKYVANLVLELDPNLPPIPCIVGDINQVVLNMIINAAHAIQEKLGAAANKKGTITISTREENNNAIIKIRDTGVGIPEHLKAKIFDLFFTTKEVGKGTGQGLAISHSVVTEKHGGYIICESHVGEGTTFSIHLPIGEQENNNE